MTKCKVCGHTVCDLCDDKCHYCEKYPKVVPPSPPSKKMSIHPLGWKEDEDDMPEKES